MDYILGLVKSLNVMHKAVPGVLRRDQEKYLFKLLSWSDRNIFNSFAILQPNLSSYNNAYELIDQKIKLLYGNDVEVIGIYATRDDSIFLGVEDDLGGELIQYRIEM